MVGIVSVIEQLAIGHRDGLFPLDESGDQDGKVGAHEKAKKLAFLFSRNRARTLDKTYQKKINLTVRDFRVIVLSTSEVALKTIAQAAGQPRIGGEEVRFIDVPIGEPGSVGVFDGVKLPSGRDPSEVGRMLADNLRRDAVINQGFVMDAFLRKFMRNPEVALARTKHHMGEFTADLSMTLKTGPDRRICANFSFLYAAAALGIEYGITALEEEGNSGRNRKMYGQCPCHHSQAPLPPNHICASSLPNIVVPLQVD